MKTDKGILSLRERFHGTSLALGLKIGRVARSPRVERLKGVAIRHPGVALAILGSFGWLIATLGGRTTTQATVPPARVVTSVRPEPKVVVPLAYATLAGRLADEYQLTRGPSEPGRDLNVILAELRNAALDLNGLKSNDPEILAIAKEARGIFGDATASLERLLSLPKPPGQLELSGEFFLRGFVFDIPGMVRRYEQVSGVQEDLLATLRRLAVTIKRGEAARLMLPRIAARYAGPPHQGGPAALAIDFDETWYSTDPGDWLTLSNTCGGDLHNATVLVEVQGEAGDIARSVHFVPAWPAGTTISARYTGGDESLGVPVARQTVSNVASVIVSLWSEERTQEGLTLAYAGARRDEDIARYCSALQVRARFRPFQRGLVWNTQRGMELWLDGIAVLGKPRVTATFRRGGLAQTLSWNFDRWDRGERKVLDAGKALTWDPEEVVIAVSFAHTGYQHVTRWTPK